MKAEIVATSLKNAREQISDSLLVAMILKGLPMQYKTFITVITKTEREMSFMEFKVALRSFEETDKCQPKSLTSGERVMTAQSAQRTFKRDVRPNNSVTCYTCGKPGHKSFECRSGREDKRAERELQINDARHKLLSQERFRESCQRC